MAWPKRTSLPSKFVPATPAACWAGVPLVSAMYTTATATMNSVNMAA